MASNICKTHTKTPGHPKKPPKHITLKHINARSLLSDAGTKLEIIKQKLYDEDIDVLCVSETWLKKNTNNDLIQIEKYKIFRCDGPNEVRGNGGSCIYVKDIYNSKEIKSNDHAGDRPEGIEDVWVKIQVNKFKSIIVSSVYKHPNSKSECLEYLEKSLQYNSNQNLTMYVLGDMNENMMKRNKLNTIIKKLNLSQLVTKPTRITEESSTLIDILITNKEEAVSACDLGLSVADHLEITCNINLAKKKPKARIINTRCHSNYSPKILFDDLMANTAALNNIYCTNDVNKQVEIFTSTFIQAIDRCAPRKSIIIRRPPNKWMSEELKSELEKNKSLQMDFKRTSSPSAKLKMSDSHKTQKKKVKKMLINAKRTYFHKELKEKRNNSKETWATLKQVIPGKAKSTSCAFKCEKQTVEKFNDFFSKIGESTFKTVTDLSESPQIEINNQDNEQGWHPKTIVFGDVTKIISKMKNTNSTGHDDISIRYIKESLMATINHITHIINTSITTSVFPSAWKHAIITAIHKSGDVEEPTNFRPISLLPTIAKILEKVVQTQLVQHLEENKSLITNQFAYRLKSSTEHALQNITEPVYNAMDNSNVSMLVMLDLSKAFDSVNHKYLLDKIENLGINRLWFQSYLTGRTHSVRIGQNVSYPAVNNFGVPQGSILGPTLFSLFTNDIPQSNSGENKSDEMSIYADDVQLLFCTPTHQLDVMKKRVEATLKTLSNWYQTNGLKFNSSKTQCILIGTPSKIKNITPLAIEFNGTLINTENNVKNLGVWFDQHLSFDHHIKLLCSRMNGALSYINKMKMFLDKESRLLVVYALVFSHLNYCSTIWGKCSKELLYQIQKSINFAAKVVCPGRHSKRDHVTPLLTELKWLKINQILNLNQAVFVHKTLQQADSSNIKTTVFTKLVSLTNRDIRHKNDLYLERSKTSVGSRALSISGAKTWNSIPEEIKKVTTTSTFKSNLHAHYLEELLSSNTS